MTEKKSAKGGGGGKCENLAARSAVGSQKNVLLVFGPTGRRGRGGGGGRKGRSVIFSSRARVGAKEKDMIFRGNFHRRRNLKSVLKNVLSLT